MTLTILGSGTSNGVPVIACQCRVCKSEDPHDKRLRAAALIQNEFEGKTTNILIDLGPDFRSQALRENLTALDLILLTHGHADHLHGLDDIRVFSHSKMNHPEAPDAPSRNAPPEGIHIYADRRTRKIVKTHFDYIFMHTQLGGGKPRIKLLNTRKLKPKTPLKTGGMEIISLPMKHGKISTTGYLISTYGSGNNKHSIAYLTDCNFISDKTVRLIRENAGILEHAVIDGLRKKSHSTHFSFEEALALADRIQAKHTWTTHMTHNSTHEEIKKYFREILCKYPALEKIVRQGGSVEPAYDGLKISC